MIRFLMIAALMHTAVLLEHNGSAFADDWPQFRGPGSTGRAGSQAFPTQWSPQQNIRWSSDMPHAGNGSPVVFANRVFVCSSENAQGTKRALLCFDADSGEQRWKQTVSLDREMPTHKTNPYGGSTPACDGEYVVAWHATAGLHAYTVDGETVWERDLGEFRHMWGYGTSPIIVGDMLVLNSGPGKRVFVAAFDRKTGETIWRHDEPVEGDGEYNTAKKYVGTWSSPVPVKLDGASKVVVAMHKRIICLETKTGKLAWHFPVVSDRGELAYSAPMIAEELCIFNAGFKGPTIAFDMRGGGDLSDQQRWRIDANPQSIGTGVIHNGHCYRIGAGPNLIECIDVKTGEILWQQRHAKAFWGSLTQSGDTAYATDQAGTTVLFQLTPDRFKSKGICMLEDTCNSTPALANGRVYLRTDNKLWCIDTEH